MNNEKLIMKALNYLLWVHQPRSDRSEEDRDKLMVDLQLAINPIEYVPYAESLEDNRICPDCKGLIRIRNPTGKCDHLYYPENKFAKSSKGEKNGS